MIEKIEKAITESTEYQKFRSVLSVLFNWIHNDFCFGIFSRFEKKFVKYLFVGFMNTVISYIIYAIIVTILNRPSLSLAIQYVLCIFINFQTTGRIVFKNKDNSLITKFILCYLTTFVINRYALDTMVSTMGMDKYLSQALLVFPIAMISFMLLKHFVFSSKNEE